VAARADFDRNSRVDFDDVLRLSTLAGTQCQPDVNKDGLVNTNDVWAVLSSWGPCEVPSWDGCRAADVDGDGRVTSNDVAQIASLIGETSAREDLDGDTLVTQADVVIAQAFEARSRLNGCISCPADLTDDGRVDEDDHAKLVGLLGESCAFDLNRDGTTCPRDLELVEAYFGSEFPLSAAALRADFVRDGVIDTLDANALSDWIAGRGRRYDTTCRADLNRDGRIDVNDVWFLLAAWGDCPAGSMIVPRSIEPDVCNSVDKED